MNPPPGNPPPGKPGVPGAVTPAVHVQEQPKVSKGEDSGLAFTGAEVLAPALAGLALVGAGGAAVVASRRRSTE